MIEWFKMIGGWVVSLVTSKSSEPAPPPEPEPPLPPVAKGGWEDAHREAEAEIARRRDAGGS